MPQLLRIAHYVQRPNHVAVNLERRGLHRSLGCVHDDSGQVVDGCLDEAIAEYERASSLSPDVDYLLAALAHAYGRKGDRVASEQRLSRLLERRQARYVSGVELALAHLGNGDTEKAIEWLRSAVAERDGSLPFVAIEPLFLPLHADERFQKIVAIVRSNNSAE